MSIRATYGIIIWNQNFKDKGVVLPIVIYLITAMLTGYCIIQIQKLGYVPDIMGVNREMGFIRKLINIAFVLAVSIPPAYVGLLRFERFFSNKTELISVSYTHLDVYKRQGFDMELVTANTGQAVCKTIIIEIIKLINIFNLFLII